MDDILNPRRAPRVLVRCAVEIRHHLAHWRGETEDLSPGGCQIVTPRLVEAGAEVKLAMTVRAWRIVKVHAPVPVQAPLQPAKTEPASAVAVSETTVASP